MTAGLSAALAEVAALEEEENLLDRLIESSTIQLKHLTEDAENNRLAYVTYHDIRKVEPFSGDTVIAVKAPAETKLEVPDPREVGVASFLMSSNSTSVLSVSLCSGPFEFLNDCLLVCTRVRPTSSELVSGMTTESPVFYILIQHMQRDKQLAEVNANMIWYSCNSGSLPVVCMYS